MKSIKSIGILFKYNRAWYFAGFIFIALLTMFFSSMIEKVKYVQTLLHICLGICLLSGLFLDSWINRKIDKSFPVPDFVLSWRPLIVLGISFLIMFITFSMGIFLSTSDIWIEFFHNFKLIPMYFLLGILILRYNKIHTKDYHFPVNFAYFFLILSIHGSKITKAFPPGTGFLSILICIYFIYERPYLFKNRPGKESSLGFNIIPPVPVLIGTLLINLIFWASIVVLWRYRFRGDSEFINITIFLITALYLMALFMKYFNLRKSGFSRKQSIIPVILHASIIGIAFTGYFIQKYKKPHILYPGEFPDNKLNSMESMKKKILNFSIFPVMIIAFILFFPMISQKRNRIINQYITITVQKEIPGKNRLEFEIVEKILCRKNIDKILEKSLKPKYTEYADKFPISISGEKSENIFKITIQYPEGVNPNTFSNLIKKELELNSEKFKEIEIKTEYFELKLFQRFKSGKRFLKFKKKIKLPDKENSRG
jgi:hypothetical protein